MTTRTILDSFRTDFIDGIEMVRIPKFYIKKAFGNSGLILSEKKIDGGSIYPSFIDKLGKVHDYIYISAYPFNTDGKFDGSAQPKQMDYTSAVTSCLEASDKGSLMGYWEVCALVLLACSEYPNLWTETNVLPDSWRGIKLLGKYPLFLGLYSGRQSKTYGSGKNMTTHIEIYFPKITNLANPPGVSQQEISEYQSGAGQQFVRVASQFNILGASGVPDISFVRGNDNDLGVSSSGAICIWRQGRASWLALDYGVAYLCVKGV